MMQEIVMRLGKIRKHPIERASMAGAATCNSLPSWRHRGHAPESCGEAARDRQKLPYVKPPAKVRKSTKQMANMDIKRDLTTAVSRGYKTGNQWLVLKP